MSLTRTRLRVAVRVMRYYNSVPLTGAMPVMAPFRGCANHSFTSGYDCVFIFYNGSPSILFTDKLQKPDSSHIK